MSVISSSTTSTTAYKVTADTTGTLVFQTGATPTTALTLGTDQSATFAGTQTFTGGATFTSGITVQGLTVGKGAGAVSTNTAVGASALASNSTGTNITVLGYQAGYSDTASYLTAVGYQAAYSNTTGEVTAVGNQAAYTNTTGNLVGIGPGALYFNTTGSYNTAVGGRDASNYAVMRGNTTGSYNVAMGHGSLANNTTGSYNTAVGYQAGYSLVGGTDVRNTFIGYSSGWGVSTGTFNTYVGQSAGPNTVSNSSASANVGIGSNSLTAITTGGQNTAVGYNSGSSLTTGVQNTFVGPSVPGVGAAGYLITTGSKNTILGGYNGNQGGLDIRTASNKVVLSDGDGNPVFGYGIYPNGAGSFSTAAPGYATIGLGGTGATGTGGLFLNGEATSGYGPVLCGFANGAGQWYVGSNSWIKGGTTYSTLTCTAGGAGGGVNLSSGATSWSSASDERLKDIIEPITDAASKVSTLRAVIGKYKDDEEGTRRSFLIAQDVQAVLPEAVTEGRNAKDDETEYLQLSYTEVIPLLVAAIKELKADLDATKAELAALKGAA